ncbi:efflux RND transporter periplasmic adaptor subunit [Ferruginibacter paludis]|uniref:efflux RND transporter periplasmic adaptor subunit n=1 Tax=Ferruginibacter paludis TaxID=1310417 RepID=UPI0025B2F23D|nr:efflux RND transporter periplasmic adaptor subunit [Ferruginibacter paludis]MDN3658406.1 efflux RND transporter periplasmic adaptor subunit [Ferruginibacter paludis]
MKVTPIVTLLFFAAILFSCKDKKEPEADPNAKICITDSMEQIIHIDSASSGNIENALKLSGEISFSDSKVVKVFPFSSGKVMEVKVSQGDKVNKGQVLATIKSVEVAGNYSDLSTAENDYNISKRQLDNEASLYKNGIASEREYSEAKENYSKAATAVQKLKEQISINGGGHTNIGGSYVITAPIAGYVVEKKINAGAFIRADNTENMFTIGDISEVWVWANVYETDITKVKEGYTANVTTLAYPDKIFTGIIDKVSQILDPETKVMKIRVRLKNDNLQLKPEMFANITVLNKEGQDAISIPATAIVSENGNNYVVLYRGKCDLKVQQVELLKISGDKAYLKSGLQAGEKVISANQILLYRALTEK